MKSKAVEIGRQIEGKGGNGVMKESYSSCAGICDEDYAEIYEMLLSGDFSKIDAVFNEVKACVMYRAEEEAKIDALFRNVWKAGYISGVLDTEEAAKIAAKK